MTNVLKCPSLVDKRNKEELAEGNRKGETEDADFRKKGVGGYSVKYRSDQDA